MLQQQGFNFLKIDTCSATPKYLQVRDSIVSALECGKLKKGDVLPSINDLSYILDISRDTTEKGYRYLKNTGFINSIPGKGYYISNSEYKKDIRVCLLFNKLSAHKKIIYDAFSDALGDQAFIDFYIYNNDYAIFKKLIKSTKNDYSHYVIIPHFVDGGEDAFEIIDSIPKEKLLILDKQVQGVNGDYASIYENFATDIYQALTTVLPNLSKYRAVKIVFPKKSYYPKEILKGIKLFCNQYGFNFVVVDNMEKEVINRGDLYINVMEDDLVQLLEKVINLGLEVGKDVGIISYNETPLKKYILNGITTVSTDFKMMGYMAAQAVLNNSKAKHAVPFNVILRDSL
ncbi:substrate-binding domain-containing protein [Pedobacter jamesrossensis]|uniref:Substrate-binding domain-containing protein n=1 Tax=Pedobacter jamesrossensis TaxID=1908238 RepID=A0ABV8NM02_9SPHI